MKKVTVELEQLFKKLEENKHLFCMDDLVISEPNEDEDDWYICCEQKIIRFEQGVFFISCLYDSHKTLEFASIDEVVALYDGMEAGVAMLANAPEKGKEVSAVQKAFNVGLYLDVEANYAVLKSSYEDAISKKRQFQYKSPTPIDNN